MATEYRTPSDLYPCLVYQDARRAITWLCKVFGFTEQFTVDGPDGTVVHSELSLGTGVLMVSSEKPEFNRYAAPSALGAPASLSVYVDDPDTHHTHAVAAGAKVTRPLQDEEYGARSYGAEDLEGNQWYFGNYHPGNYWRGQPVPQNSPQFHVRHRKCMLR